MLTKQEFKRQNPINWESTNCFICGFRLPTTASNFPSKKMTPLLDFVIEKGRFSSGTYSIIFGVGANRLWKNELCPEPGQI